MSNNPKFQLFRKKSSKRVGLFTFVNLVLSFNLVNIYFCKPKQSLNNC